MKHFYTTIQKFISCSSYTIDNYIILDYDDRFDHSSNTISENSEIDEEVDSTFSEDQDDKSSLDYMKQVLAYDDEVDGHRNRKHSW